MANRLKELRKKAVYFRRNEGLSYSEICERIGQIPKGTLSYWLKNVPLTKKQKARLKQLNPFTPNSPGRKKGNKIRGEKCRKKRLDAQEKGKTEAKNTHLHLAGCMLYWAEGAKQKNTVRFVNSDLDMMKLFLRFLVECYGIEKKDIIVVCHSHFLSDQTLDDVEKFWLKSLGLPKTCLRKGYVETRVPKKKKVKYPNGICTISVYNTEIVQRIFGSIQKYANIKTTKWVD